MRVVWTRPALANLEAIADYLGDRNPAAAHRVVNAIHDKVETLLPESPKIGRPGAKRLVRVAVEHIFTNCPRYIPKMGLQEPSVYAPKAGHTPPEPAWKSRDMVRDLFEAEREE